MRRKKIKEPSYLQLSEKKFLAKLKDGKEILRKCSLCGNSCGVDRVRGDKGRCGIDANLWVSSYNLHTGEEPPVSGTVGSGTVFLTGCCLSCVFCQNYPISQLRNGRKISSDELAKIMIDLENRGAHNINFVSPTHQVPQILEGIFLARRLGLDIPIVYNTGGYDSPDCLNLLNGIVDIYLPDFKYEDNGSAFKYSGVKNYFDKAKIAIAEMHRQVGDLILDESGVGVKGLLIRHLILPCGVTKTKQVFECIKKNISLDVHASVMGQYFPAYKALKIPKLNRKISRLEYMRSLNDILKLGFKNIYTQVLEFETSEGELSA